MALPNKIDSATPSGTEALALGDDRIRELKQAILDILGIPNNTLINNALFEVAAAGLRSVFLQDAATDPTVAGQLRRVGTTLRYHTGAAVITIGEPFPSGTRMIFNQATPPVGWTRVVDAANTDAVVILRLNNEVPGAGGSWTVSGLTFTGSALPAHSHSLLSSSQGGPPAGTAWVFANDPMNIHTAGTFTGPAGTAARPVTASVSAGTPSGTIGSDGSWRPKYVDCIVASKS
jgi:hypothetical protein